MSKTAAVGGSDGNGPGDCFSRRTARQAGDRNHQTLVWETCRRRQRLGAIARYGAGKRSDPPAARGGDGILRDMLTLPLRWSGAAVIDEMADAPLLLKVSHSSAEA